MVVVSISTVKHLTSNLVAVPQRSIPLSFSGLPRLFQSLAMTGVRFDIPFFKGERLPKADKGIFEKMAKQ